MGTRAEPSPWLVALLAAGAGVAGAWLAGVSAGDAPAAPATAPPPIEASVAPEPASPGAVRSSPLAPTPAVVTVWATSAGAPAAGAGLELHRPRPGTQGSLLLASALLDAQGHAELLVGPGPYLVTVRQGRAAASQAFEVAPGHAQQLLLALGETWTAHLSVVSAGGGRPLADAEVRLVGDRAIAPPATGQGARGDSLGRVELAGLPPGPARVRVKARGALPATVELAPGNGAPEVVALEEASFVTGAVLDENGTVLAGVRVGTGGGLDEDLTDARGRFRAPCRPGDVVVVAIDPAGRSATERVAVAAGATAPGVVLRLGAPRRLEGLVTQAADGGPVPGALVRAEALSGVEVARATTSAAGTFELDGLPPGWVNVRAEVGRGARGAALGVATEGGERVLVPLAAAAALWGVVSSGDGQPVAGAAVRVVARGGQELPWAAVTDTEGRYRLEDLPAGAVSVEAALEGEASSGSTRVVLEAGAASRADLSVGRDGAVEGTVRGPPGQRLVALAFGGVPDERVPRQVPAGAGGRYHLRLPAGRWHLSAHAEDRRHVSVLDGEEVVVEPGQTLHRDLEAAPEPSGDPAALEDAYSVEEGTLGASFDAAGGQVRVTWLSARGPAARAGLAPGEVLLAVDGLEVHDSLQAFERTRGAPGSPVSLRVQGGGGERTVEVRRQAGPSAPRRAAAP